jgi:hypothetical protein
MSNWPSWVIGIGIFVIIIFGIAYYFPELTIRSGTDVPSWRKNKNGKK